MAKVLLVEDEKLISAAVTLLLEKEKIIVDHAYTGTQAINKLKKPDYDLIILDIMLPEISGSEIFEKIRSDKKTKDIKVMILTAKVDACRWNKKLKTCNLFFTKPFENHELVNAVKKMLSE